MAIVNITSIFVKATNWEFNEWNISIIWNILERFKQKWKIFTLHWKLTTYWLKIYLLSSLATTCKILCASTILSELKNMCTNKFQPQKINELVGWSWNRNYCRIVFFSIRTGLIHKVSSNVFHQMKLIKVTAYFQSAHVSFKVEIDSSAINSNSNLN